MSRHSTIISRLRRTATLFALVSSALAATSVSADCASSISLTNVPSTYTGSGSETTYSFTTQISYDPTACPQGVPINAEVQLVNAAGQVQTLTPGFQYNIPPFNHAGPFIVNWQPGQLPGGEYTFQYVDGTTHAIYQGPSFSTSYTAPSCASTFAAPDFSTTSTPSASTNPTFTFDETATADSLDVPLTFSTTYCSSADPSSFQFQIRSLSTYSVVTTAATTLSLDTNAGTGTLAVSWGGPTNLPAGQYRIYLVDPSRTIVIGDFGVDYSGATCAESISFSFPPSSNEETFVLVAGQPSYSIQTTVSYSGTSCPSGLSADMFMVLDTTYLSQQYLDPGLSLSEPFNPTSGINSVGLTIAWSSGELVADEYEISVAGPGELYLSNPFNIEYQTIGPQPTIALRKRREAREAAGEQAPYKYEARCGEAGMTSCHVAGSIWECLNVMSDLEHCGACPNSPGHVDCTQLAFAESVGCEQGRCNVYSCVQGWVPAVNGSMCVEV